MRSKFNLLLGTACCLIALLVFGGKTHAASQAPSGITVSPAFQLVTIGSDAAEQPINFAITNDKSTAQAISLSVADFNTLNESGGLFFVGTNPTALQKKYGLAKWVSLPASQLSIPAKQTVEVQADVLNLPTLSGGGHYGALMIALDSKTGSGTNEVGLQPIASSLLFVTKPAGATYDLSLTNVNFSHSILHLPSSVSLRFLDFGNTHLIPRGVVSITDGKGRLISKGIINENSGIILPQAYRVYDVPLSKVISASLPGRYKLSVSYRFDGYNQVRVYQANLYVIGPVGILILVVIVAALSIFVSMLLKRKRRKHHGGAHRNKTKKINVEVVQ